MGKNTLYGKIKELLENGIVPAVIPNTDGDGFRIIFRDVETTRTFRKNFKFTDVESMAEKENFTTDAIIFAILCSMQNEINDSRPNRLKIKEGEDNASEE